MTDKLLLAVCAVLIGFGILTIAVSSGFFMNLLGAGIMASGGQPLTSFSPIERNSPLLVRMHPKIARDLACFGLRLNL